MDKIWYGCLQQKYSLLVFLHRDFLFCWHVRLYVEVFDVIRMQHVQCKSLWMYWSVKEGSTYLDKDALVMASGLTWQCYYRTSRIIE
jgi:hypothetical protein